MSDIVPAIEAYFAAQSQWPSVRSEKPRGVEVQQNWSNTPFKSVAHQLRGGPIFVYDSLCPATTPPERRVAVAHFIARVNFELIVGTFSIDWRTGAVRLRSAVDLRGQLLTPALIEGVVLSHHQIMIDWLAHLMGVIQGEQEPDEAFTEAFEQLG